MRLLIIILLSGGAGFLIPLSFPDLIPHQHETSSTSMHEHAHENHHDHHTHMHSAKEIDSTLPIPSVTFRAENDRKGGYNIFIDLENYTFVPEKASTDTALPNEGHAHLYVDQQKVGRVYGNAYHIPEDFFTLGKEQTISLTLSAHTHEERHYNGEVIGHTVSILHGDQ